METRQGDMCTALTLIFSIEMNSRKLVVCHGRAGPTHGGADYM
ncbi:MAG TPA: hypothetical protein VHP33_41315 [Polyangiaceae bacterium]|nr:hypothetical protein [Polyangiaceae bacterium]